MPIDFTAGTLYIQEESGGEMIPIPVTSLSFTSETTDPMPSTVRLIEPVEFECKATVDQHAILSLLLGRKITNNWLKMHGGVMSRKGVKKHGV